MVHEKFRRYEDHGTGIVPFEPLLKKTKNPLMRFALAVVGLALFVIRAPCFIVVVGFMWFFAALCSVVGACIQIPTRWAQH